MKMEVRRYPKMSDIADESDNHSLITMQKGCLERQPPSSS